MSFVLSDKDTLKLTNGVEKPLLIVIVYLAISVKQGHKTTTAHSLYVLQQLSSKNN